MKKSKGTYKRKKYEKIVKKDYSKSYLEQKRKRLEKPNNYPKTRLILIKDFFRARDLYKGLFFFFSSQVSIITLASSNKYPHIAGALNLLAIILGIIPIVFAIREINKRQYYDDTRRSFRLATSLKGVIYILFLVVTMTYIFNKLGINMVKQPNQTSIENLLTDYPITMLFIMVFVSPITEEIVFRELLPYASGPSYLSFGISSIIFVALHAPFGLMGWTNYGILSAVFLYTRLKDNNVYTAIVTHIIWNALTIII